MKKAPSHSGWRGERRKSVLVVLSYRVGFVALHRVPRDIKAESSDSLTSCCSVFHVLSACSRRSDWFSSSSTTGVWGHEVWFVTDVPFSLILCHSHTRGMRKDHCRDWTSNTFPDRLWDSADFRKKIFLCWYVFSLWRWRWVRWQNRKNKSKMVWWWG